MLDLFELSLLLERGHFELQNVVSIQALKYFYSDTKFEHLELCTNPGSIPGSKCL